MARGDSVVSDIKYMDIAAFRGQGYLQEVNRRFLHPLGLALEVTVVDDGGWEPDSRLVKAGVEYLATEKGWPRAEAEYNLIVALNALYPPGTAFISGVWDYRDDPEGVYFGDVPDVDKFVRVARELAQRAKAREARLGYVVQPVPQDMGDEK